MTSVITGLRERTRGRVAVELDGRPWRELPTDAIVRSGLVVGRPLDRPTARKLGREVRRAGALAAAERALAATDRSEQALEQRLARAGHSTAARRDAVASLARTGAIDDARLAERRVEALARRGYGDAAIRADLGRRSIAPEAAARALTALEPEVVRLRRALESESVTPALLRRLARRGFSRACLDEVASSFALEA